MLLRDANNVVASSIIISHDSTSFMLLGIKVQIMCSFNSQIQSYVKIDGQSTVLVSIPYLRPKTTFLLLSNSCSLLTQGILSEKRTGVSLAISAVSRQRSHTRIKVTQDS
jgi:hypothetical protein